MGSIPIRSTMKSIVIASKNPIKVSATLKGFQKMFPEEEFQIESVSVPSGVMDQPKNDRETYQGAWNRADNASELNKGADFWVGIEGGICERNRDMEAFAWAVVKSAKGRLGRGKTGTFFLPPKIAVLIRQGKELGEADDIVFKRNGSKRENGAVGILTGDVIDRTMLYTEAEILALIPFKNKKLYR